MCKLYKYLKWYKTRCCETAKQEKNFKGFRNTGSAKSSVNVLNVTLKPAITFDADYNFTFLESLHKSWQFSHVEWFYNY